MLIDILFAISVHILQNKTIAGSSFKQMQYLEDLNSDRESLYRYVRIENSFKLTSR